MIKKNKRTTAAIASLAALGLIAGAIAVFTTKFDVKNVFKVDQPNAKFVETFTPPLTGEEIFGNTYNKSGQVINSGTTEVKARLKLTVGWYDSLEATEKSTTVNNKFGIAPSEMDAATLTFNGTEYLGDWSTLNANDCAVAWPSGKNEPVKADANWAYDTTDKYFYYQNADGKNIIPAKAGNVDGVSEKFLESVKFNTELQKTQESTVYSVTPKNGTAKEFATMDEALAELAANAGDYDDKTVTITSETNYIESRYNDKYYKVILSGEIINVNEDWQ